MLDPNFIKLIKALIRGLKFIISLLEKVLRGEEV
jgi:hypothetical protein